MSDPNEHSRLLALAVAHMKERGMTNLKAHGIDDYSQPDVVNGFRPDATGVYQNRPVLVEAETTQGLNTTHTHEQVQAFYNYAKSVNGWLILAVLETDKKATQSLLDNAAGRGAIVWTF